MKWKIEKGENKAVRVPGNNHDTFHSIQIGCCQGEIENAYLHRVGKCRSKEF